MNSTAEIHVKPYTSSLYSGYNTALLNIAYDTAALDIL